jgi:hypothetical protein
MSIGTICKCNHVILLIRDAYRISELCLSYVRDSSSKVRNSVINRVASGYFYVSFGGQDTSKRGYFSTQWFDCTYALLGKLLSRAYEG